MQSFKEMDLVPALREALDLMNYETPTPVQAQSIPLVLEGSDLMACAQTGTGKTAAFALPLLARLSDKRLNNGDRKSVLILAPTRELVEQIAEVLKKLTVKLKHHRLALIIGGVGYNHQIRDLRANPSFIIATPGRLIDHLEAGRVRLDQFGVLVLDEADRMLDMGFAPQLEEIVSRMPVDRQTLLFSATLDGDVAKIAKKYLRNPKSVSVAPAHKPIEKIAQNVVRTLQKEKPSTLIREIDKIAGSIIIFTRTKSRTEQVAKNLAKAGHEVELIHGDRSQGQRKRALEAFRRGEARILVATDVAARGLDIPHIEHVINYDLPTMPEDYVHRIGRTARAGREGSAWSFVTPEEEGQWNRIYKMMYGKFPEGAVRPGGAKRPWEKNQERRQEPRRNDGGTRRMGHGDDRSARRGAHHETPMRGDRIERSERPEVRGFGDRPPRREDRQERSDRPRLGVQPQRPERNRTFAPRKDETMFSSRADRDADRARRKERDAKFAERGPRQEEARESRPATRPSSRPAHAEGGNRPPQKQASPKPGTRRNDPTKREAGKPRGGKSFSPPWARDKKPAKPAGKPRHKSLI